MNETFKEMAEDYVFTVHEYYDGDFDALSFEQYLLEGYSVVESDGYIERAKKEWEEE